ncbi:MAG TPA: glycerate kinase, partial [Flavitalea sp.]|nr:glycerate kinase [Flavitalea sp.]
SLLHIGQLLEKQSGRKIVNVAGTGAAGGIAAGLMAFFDVTIKSGILLVLESSGLQYAMPDCNLVITGEGKMDLQTLDGKVIQGITRLARQWKKPVIAYCGESHLSADQLQSLGINAVFSLMEISTSKEDAILFAEKKLSRAVSLSVPFLAQLSGK